MKGYEKNNKGNVEREARRHRGEKGEFKKKIKIIYEKKAKTGQNWGGQERRAMI